MRKPLKQGDRISFPIFSNPFKKPLPAKVAAFFPGFISVQHQALGRAPMNSSLVSYMVPQGLIQSNGRVFSISSLF
jgi:hypothetical protein